MAKVVTKKKNPVRLSYVNVFKPRPIEGSDPKYSVCIMFPKADKALKKIFDEAIKQTAVDDASKWGGKIPANLKYPIHDGDVSDVVRRADKVMYENKRLCKESKKHKASHNNKQTK